MRVGEGGEQVIDIELAHELEVLMFIMRLLINKEIIRRVEQEPQNTIN